MAKFKSGDHVTIIFNEECLFSGLRGLSGTIEGDHVLMSEAIDVENRAVPDAIYQYKIKPDKPWPFHVEDYQLFPERLLKHAE